ncbi:MAG: hypothetical protein V1729_05495 [Candidatus Woesearchaeota archaeon]
MTNPFPQELIDLQRKVLEIGRLETRFKRRHRKKMPLAIMKIYETKEYGFADCLRTGNYAPYTHEMDNNMMCRFNCTTIIPELYTVCDIFDLNPKIVQFKGFRDRNAKKHEQGEPWESHFAVIVEPSEGKRVLIDPFMHKYGTISEETENRIKVRKSPCQNGFVREFEEMVEYPAEDFARMMERLKDPAESLDMLVAGQRLNNGLVISDKSANLMIYYDDDTNQLSTMLYLPQIVLQDRAIICRQQLDDRGDTLDSWLEFYYTKGADWKHLKDAKKVAVLRHDEIDRINSALRSEFSPRNSMRPGKSVQESVLIDDFMGDVLREETGTPIAPVMKNVFRFVKKCTDVPELAKNSWDRLTEEEQETILMTAVTRSAYEMTLPEARYIFSEQERDSYLAQNLREEYKLKMEYLPLEQRLRMHELKMERLDRKEAARLSKKIEAFKNLFYPVDTEIAQLLSAREYSNAAYHRTMDKRLFVKSLEDLGDEGIKKAAEAVKADMMTGYIGMICDFMPYAVDGHDELMLTRYIDDIRMRVRARRSNRAEKDIAKGERDEVEIPRYGDG